MPPSTSSRVNVRAGADAGETYSIIGDAVCMFAGAIRITRLYGGIPRGRKHGTKFGRSELTPSPGSPPNFSAERSGAHFETTRGMLSPWALGDHRSNTPRAGRDRCYQEHQPIREC